MHGMADSGIIARVNTLLLPNEALTHASRWWRRVLPASLYVRWALRAVALIIVINLGLLSPLSCVIHCTIQRLFVEKPAIGLFLCGDHGVTAEQPTPIPETPAVPTPRALYELLPVSATLLVLFVHLITTVEGYLHERPWSLNVPPPTPPPRLSIS